MLQLTLTVACAIIKMPKQDSECVMTEVFCSLAGGVNAPPFSFVIIAFFVVFCQKKSELILGLEIL